MVASSKVRGNGDDGEKAGKKRTVEPAPRMNERLPGVVADLGLLSSVNGGFFFFEGVSTAVSAAHTSEEE
jgi:hypothetical protein